MSYTIALAGNPNCGKTTLFNALTGASQRVGNWPGVTIDKKVGKIRGTDSELVDLPGIYSMSPYSPEEIVSRNFIIDERPDALINIVDATNLERNLFLTLQLIDMGTPMVVALNMMDMIESAGDKIDVDGLSRSLGVPVVPISASKKTGIDELVKKIVQMAESKSKPSPTRYGSSFESAVSAAEEAVRGKVPDDSISRTSPEAVPCHQASRRGQGRPGEGPWCQGDDRVRHIGARDGVRRQRRLHHR